jgi:fructosamine-3-kinase
MSLGGPLAELYQSALFYALGKEVEVLEARFQTGGCISTAARLITDHGEFFIKWNTLQTEMFEAEAKGLALLHRSGTVHCPEVLHVGKYEDMAYILMEFIRPGRAIPTDFAALGRQLAALHRIHQANFGLDHDNFIGRLEQRNTFTQDWLSFFIENRLQVQAGLAFYKGLVDQKWLDRFKSLYPHLQDFFPSEPSALLHGDLWSGNIHFGEQGHFYLIDPAVYFGHREMEIAFTRLFGGFDEAFYRGYQEAYPLAPGFEDRVEIYNLYPLLVHANLFGASYLHGIDRLLSRFLP